MTVDPCGCSHGSEAAAGCFRRHASARLAGRCWSALNPAFGDGVAALVNDLDKGPLLALYGEPDRTEPVRELLAITPRRIIGWEIESALVLDLTPIDDMEMVDRHRLSNGRTLIQFRHPPDDDAACN